MLNKNVADYTNFQGKTNKRIVQAPGGASSISLAWDTQSKDKNTYNKYKSYGKQISQPDPAYILNNKYQQQNHNNPFKQQYQQKDPYSPYAYGTPSTHNSSGSNNAHTNRNMNNLYSYGQMGGELGYKGYVNSNNGYLIGHAGNNGYGTDSNVYSQESRNGSGYYSSPTNNNNNNNNYIKQQINSINFSLPKSPSNRPLIQQLQSAKNNYSLNNNLYNPVLNPLPNPVNSNYNYQNQYKSGDYSGYSSLNPNIQQLDVAIKQQYNKNKSYSHNNNQSSNRSHNAQQYQFRPSVKVLGPPPQQFHIGNADYNFWKDDEKDDIGKSRNRVQRQIQSQKRIVSNQNKQKTSVKVSNPPGGKQNFTFG